MNAEVVGRINKHNELIKLESDYYKEAIVWFKENNNQEMVKCYTKSHFIKTNKFIDIKNYPLFTYSIINSKQVKKYFYNHNDITLVNKSISFLKKSIRETDPVVKKISIKYYSDLPGNIRCELEKINELKINGGN